MPVGTDFLAAADFCSDRWRPTRLMRYRSAHRRVRRCLPDRQRSTFGEEDDAVYVLDEDAEVPLA